MKKSHFPVSTRLSIFLALALGIAQSATGQETEPVTTPGFGGPDAVENQMAEDSKTWVEWKTNLKDEYGLSLSADYTSVLLTATETSTDDTGAGGIARIYGTLDLMDEGVGALVWKFEHRHAYGDTSPLDFSLGQMGYVGLQEPPFNDSDFRTQNLYWRQRLNGGRSTLIAGMRTDSSCARSF